MMFSKNKKGTGRIKKKIYISILILAALIFLFIVANIIISTKYYDDLEPKEQIEIRKTALAATEGYTSDFEKVQALMDWTHENIAFESPEGYDGGKQSSHDPLEILERGWGLCYDNSYLFELMAESIGYKVRHVALTYEGGSHAVSEVKIDDKWIFFDVSNNETHQLDEEYLSIKEILENPEVVKDSKISVYNQAVYGVNSFHGYFAPPKIPYPDINVGQFMYNIEIIKYLPFRYGKFQSALKTFMWVIIILILVAAFLVFRRTKKQRMKIRRKHLRKIKKTKI